MTDEQDYSDYSKSELQAAADEQGVEYTADDTKAELVQKLEDAAAGDGEAAPADGSDEADAEAAAYDQGPGTLPSELYPERRPTDVDVASIADPTAEYEGEHIAPLNAESWVVLDGSHDEVPDEYDGKVAAVLAWPVSTDHNLDTGTTTTYASPNGTYLVKERGQGVTLSLPVDAFQEIHTHGRPDQFA